MVKSSVPQPTARVVRRGGNSVARARRAHHRGQAAVEFAFVFIILLMGIFGCISAALWSVQAMSTTDSLQSITRIVAAAEPGPPVDPNITIAGRENPSQVQARIASGANSPFDTLKSALFGTSLSVATWGSASCNGGPHAVTICYRQVTGAGPGAPAYVEVSIKGCAATLIPKWGFGGCNGGGVAINDVSSVQAQIFTK